MTTNIRLSDETSSFADELKEIGHFDSKITACKFAFSYALKNCSEELGNPEARDAMYPPGGTNYNVGSVDNDGFMASIIKLLYPDVRDTVSAMRGIILFGLTKLEELHKEHSLMPLARLMS